MKKKKILYLLLVVVMILCSVALLASCGDGDDGDDGDTGAGGPCMNHLDTDGDGYCNSCGGEIKAIGMCIHVDIDDDKICDDCGHDMTTKTEMKPMWDSANIIMQLNLSDNNKELSSELVRYVEGGGGYQKNVDKAVATRNAKAIEETKVTVTYKYWDNVTDNNWGNTIAHIEEMVTSASTKDTPDVYSSFIYDLVGASVKGHFANLKGTSRGKGTVLAGLNYFEFVYDKVNYEKAYAIDVENDRGFMYEWMESVTLDPKNRMYVLASDYYIDMVRAFFMIPVNVSMLEDYGEDITGDRNDDDEFTIDDFYAQVEAGEWTYSLMMEYSEAVYTPDSNGNTGKWLGDDQIGFAMSDHGVAGSGIVYTTSVKIIEKQWNNAKNDWDYWYPTKDEIDGLEAFASAVNDLLNTDGVVLVKGSQAGATDISQFGTSHFLAIRKRFCDGAVLFGDIMMVGALEFSDYQDMGANAFGVVPVPIYHDNMDDDGNPIDKYLTQIHNVGRPGAIAYNTKKFVECTAFLNYQSTNSTKILNTYYTYELCYGAAGGAAGTVRMLEYLRENVRTSFDKAMEDAMGIFNADVKPLGITNLVNGDYDFNVPNLREIYGSAYPTKAAALEALTKYFQSAKD